MRKDSFRKWMQSEAMCKKVKREEKCEDRDMEVTVTEKHNINKADNEL